MNRLPVAVVLCLLLALSALVRDADAGGRRSRPLRTGQTTCWNAAGATIAGSCDWRLPNYFELQTLLDLENADPAVNAAFDTGCNSGCTVLTGSCTTGSEYWTSSTMAQFPDMQWVVSFGDGGANGVDKTGFYCVRAVRGGS